MAKKHWIQKALKPQNEGKFSDKAKAAGESTPEFAAEKKDAGGTLGKEANLAQILMRQNKKKKG
jgi:hypothetical protein